MDPPDINVLMTVRGLIAIAKTDKGNIALDSVMSRITKRSI